MNDSLRYNYKAIELVVRLKNKGIKDNQILAAIEKIPRHVFVSENLANHAYEDKPLPIDKNQTISQPYTVAFQSELLQIKPNEKVLEIGTGSGYQAAVLCEMKAKVYSIERQQQLYLKAKEVLSKLGYHPMLFYGDGYEGLPDYAPFDKILITAATKEFPKKLLEQLKIGGLMVAPIGDSNRQIMTVVKRIGADEYIESEHGAFVFVPLLKGVEE
ncbi:protein-L-isoaspartate(D-aspartate) O-methyltransferase [Dysgonomonas sp. Marseille-P4677]|uniref:protein-L-isoaspartate(D-aspartate) O-methyltransferase n=1 Tax=Dysgonomonas sp. Marseille-P4677 TaxID=2364790 RepID=UPI001914CE6D|nr:protein-L-isoaspartate(D-aspartate) O-methyltransferase [Dysgonomonas sp. Marseille-P4677]MBK5723139.1 protein-L-isoaspartate(D-aspartate) O-methyltransferase [Dysgonomonas sp. Marseille-P4677]